MNPGIYPDISNDDYHAMEGVVSRSGLWELWTKTPAHFKNGEEESEKRHFALGSAAHCAILEPDQVEARYLRGPDDRRGNKWKDAELYAQSQGQACLTSKEFDTAMFVRDSAAKNRHVQILLKGGVFEQTGVYRDPVTGMLCRVRPDIWNPAARVMADIKTAADASAEAFAKSIHNFGYHVQDHMYSDGWEHAGGGEVEGFVFIVVEKAKPYMTVTYELVPQARAEGEAIYRGALSIYKNCMETGVWPGYPDKVSQLDIPRWAYTQTNPEHNVL